VSAVPDGTTDAAANALPGTHGLPAAATRAGEARTGEADDGPAIAVVVVTHHNAEEIPGTLAALAPQLRPDDEVVIVDNASTDGTPAVARAALPGVRVIETGRNAGFAEGCNLGVDASRAALVLLLNPDTVPQPGFLDALRRTAVERPGWGAWQALVTLPDGATVNTQGNLVHFLGFGWAGGNGRPVADAPAAPVEIGFASGAAMVVRRVAWEACGGFQPHYFMYGEDLDLSLRLRLRGWGVGLQPAARATHDYAFTKGDYKWFHLERNRWWTVVGTYPSRLLWLLLPALLVFELLLLPVAWRAGWGRPKLRAQAAVLRDLPAMLRHRRAVQASRTVDGRAFAGGLTSSLDSEFLGAANAVPGVAAAQGLFWRVVRAAL
jgi:N-acetylglucosaminyl-diphospho-decaprenol L-rhamnosyltransferase